MPASHAKHAQGSGSLANQSPCIAAEIGRFNPGSVARKSSISRHAPNHFVAGVKNAVV